MALATAQPMANKKTEDEAKRYCQYASLKVDSDLIRPLKIAAITADKTIQEYVSDILNEHLSGKKGGTLIHRKPPPPAKKPGPKKQVD